jgi:NAD(P) transhydrogenase subunit alpha
MKPGSVLLDLAVEQGGNVAGSALDQTVDLGGVKIVGIGNMAGRIAADSSALYARNLTAFVGLMIKDGVLAPDLEDEILAAALIATGGAIVHPLLKPV